MPIGDPVIQGPSSTATAASYDVQTANVPPRNYDRTLVKLEGGHSTVVDMQIGELTHLLEEARTMDAHSFVWVQTPTHGDNGLVLDPNKVVALIRT